MKLSMYVDRCRELHDQYYSIDMFIVIAYSSAHLLKPTIELELLKATLNWPN